MQVGVVHDLAVKVQTTSLFPSCKDKEPGSPLATQQTLDFSDFLSLVPLHGSSQHPLPKSATTHQYRLVHAVVVVAHGNTDNVVSCGHLPAK